MSRTLPSPGLPDADFLALGRLFSSSAFRELGRRGNSPIVARLAKQTGLAQELGANHKVKDLFDLAFSILRRSEFRDEYVYRNALTQKVLLGRHSLRTAAMLSEFRVGSNKADVVILNGSSTVYEIKSERDGLRRLQSQLSAYRDVFAAVNVFCAECHVDIVRELSDIDVGVLVLNRNFSIREVRRCLSQPSRVKSSALFECLQQNEAIAILRTLGIDIPALPNTLMHAALKEIFAKIDGAKVHAAAVTTLRRTRSLQYLSSMLNDLPESLRGVALSIRISSLEQDRIINALKTPIAEALAWG